MKWHPEIIAVIVVAILFYFVGGFVGRKQADYTISHFNYILERQLNEQSDNILSQIYDIKFDVTLLEN